MRSTSWERCGALLWVAESPPPSLPEERMVSISCKVLRRPQPFVVLRPLGQQHSRDNAKPPACVSGHDSVTGHVYCTEGPGPEIQQHCCVC